MRYVRDYLEQHGHSPILFFLLCLSDDALLPELIKKEIEARHFFVLCNSKNARRSMWVREEIRMVKDAGADKAYEEIDLESDVEEQLPKLKALIKRATVFLSYSINDREVAGRIAPALRDADFRVVMDTMSLSASGDLPQQLDRSINEAARDGFVLALMSRAYLASPYAKTELSIAIDKAKKYERSNVVPIIIDETVELPAMLGSLQPFRLPPEQLEDYLPSLIRGLKKRDME